MLSGSGEKITLKNERGEDIPCRRCGVCPSTGQNWIREDGVSIYKCDSCGKKMNLGLTEAAARENKATIEGMDRADTNRQKAWREEDAKANEEMRKKVEGGDEEMADTASLEKGGFLWANFLG